MAQTKKNYDGGYILLARKLRENPVYSNSTALHIWIECLLRASFKKREFFSKREKVVLNAGEFLMGYREFSRVIGCSVSTVKYWVDTFFAERLIERQANAKGTKITVLNWKDYQDAERFTARQANAERTLSEPNKKGNELKECKEIFTHKNLIPLFEDFLKNRRELKKPATTRAVELLVKKINSVVEVDARAAIEKSIESGWSGIFFEKEKPHRRGGIIMPED